MAYASYSGCPGLGRVALNWLEQASGTDSLTFGGTNSDSVSYGTGITGSFLG